MGKIFYLMGKSSSGKDTIYKELLKRDLLKLKKIVLYTTRPARMGEQDGVQYHFVDEDTAADLVKAGRVIEMREYHTFHGKWKYFTVDDEQVDLSGNSYLMIGTIESFLKTRTYYGEERVIPIMIELDDGVRLQRALDRERSEDSPRYEEMCRRFLADAEDFSDQKKREAGITKEFYNEDLERCLSEIEAYMLSFYGNEV
ncbi:MAG: guanylate kinase [Lachnospiraceae bacterium]|nr:guanylate kinase [Lachnospiraceae bacterium]